MPHERRFGLAMAASTALLWAFLPIFLKVATARVAVDTIVWFRFTFAFAALGLLIGLRRPGRLRILRRPPPTAVLAALAITANYLTYLMAVERTGPSNTQILIQVAPLGLAVVGVVFFRERMTRGQALGAAVACVGLVLFYGDQLSQAADGGEIYNQGILWIAVAAVTWVLYAALQKRLSARGHAPQDLNLVLYVVPALVLLPIADFPALARLSPAEWALMLFLGANTLLAYGALGEALKRLPAYEVSLIITLNPLLTLAAMAVLARMDVTWIEHDRVTAAGYAGAALVVGGVARALYRGRRTAAG